MGTGKSAAGRLLAKQLHRPFLDLDEKIEKETGRPISEIFAEEGESGFREKEAEAVRAAAKLEAHVISAGGGVMLNDENVAVLKKCGVLVCLTARPDVILQRTLATLPSRPLLSGENPKGRIEELLKLREPFYARADMVIDTSDRSVEEVVEEIIEKTGDREKEKQ